ncbi:MAG: hypothetical protein B7Y81_02400 [Caulobacter sp. 32-67-35]|nr:MAG: hypothetical protein B7Y81_02400 [Caulobacter sp. 32-67-35]OZA73049.1 MAG: hypothetical protein B7X77_10620 [Caulobacter sp. 39-67-4]HQR89013.1 hypothetical protein [Caulobacter sp.]
MIDALLTDDDIASLIASKSGLARSVLQRSTRICDLGLRLDAYMAVLVAIEDRFDVEIDDLVGADCATLGALMDCLKARIVEQAAPPCRAA